MTHEEIRELLEGADALTRAEALWMLRLLHRGVEIVRIASGHANPAGYAQWAEDVAAMHAELSKK